MNSPTPASINALPLHELVAFEATARLGSLTRAAEELSVTSSAVSHRLASLQARLGVALLERQGKGIRITPQGQRYLGSIGTALREMRVHGDTLRRDEHDTLRLVAAPAIAVAWILPNLPALYEADPTLRLDLSTAALVDDLAGQDWDLLVHYGAATSATGTGAGADTDAGSGSGESSQRTALFTDHVVAVCAPALLAGGVPRDLDGFVRLPLLRHTLLSWSRWLEDAFGVARDVEPRAVFDDAPAMLEACAGGAGVALATRSACSPYLARGALVQAHPHAQRDREFFVELSPSGQAKTRARALLSWLASLPPPGTSPGTPPARPAAVPGA